jgi:L-lactate dehydrogenase (cytochrome)
VSVKRQFPRWGSIKPLLGWSWPSFRKRDRALERALTISDLRDLSAKRVPRSVFDYVEGGALQELSISRAKDAFRRVEFRPRVLRGVSKADLSREVLGSRTSMPIILAPTGYTRMMHYQGEYAVAAAAARNDLVYTLSTMGTVSPEDLVAAVPEGRKWFQLYLWQNRDQSRDFIQQARRAGFEALVLTVDTPVSGQRLRDTRNGLTVPPKITMKTFINMATKPKWWANLLTTPPLEFAAMRGYDRSLFELAQLIFDPTVTMKDIPWLQKEWGGPLIVKGVQTVEDALELKKLGVQGIVLSNHGGRQMDRGTVPLEILPEVRKAVGKTMEVYIDGSVLNGGDVLAAVAFGATGVLVGRPYLYGVMAAGSAGVDKMASIFRAEMENTMTLLGVESMSDLTTDHVRLRPLG